MTSAPELRTQRKIGVTYSNSSNPVCLNLSRHIIPVIIPSYRKRKQPSELLPIILYVSTINDNN